MENEMLLIEIKRDHSIELLEIGDLFFVIDRADDDSGGLPLPVRFDSRIEAPDAEPEVV